MTVPDTLAPTLTLTGDESIQLEVGDTFVEVGAEAEDSCDGNLDSAVLVGGDVVDMNTPATYTITYNVSDTAGNTAVPVLRNVIVHEPLEPTEMEGTAQTLFDAFEIGDEDGDGALSFAEVQRVISGLTSRMFAALDADGNGMLTQAELEAGGAVPPRGGCAAMKSRTALFDMKDFFGDLFLLGLISIVFLAWRGFGVKP